MNIDPLPTGVSVLKLLILITLLIRSAAAAQNIEFSVDETLKNASFNTGHMPTQKAFVSKYGEGKTYTRPGFIYRVYYLADLKLWLRCRGESEARADVPISEVMISKIDLGTKVSPKASVIDPNLKGIRIGDKVQLASAQWGDPLRHYTERVGSITAKVYEFFPAALGPGL
jgi:hypothetical protein